MTMLNFQPDDIIAHVKQKYGHRLDSFWKLVERRRINADWPGYCYFPAENWARAMMQMLRRPYLLYSDAPDLMAIQTYGAWRPSKDIVRIDATVYDALLDSEIKGSLPAQALLRMPAWCIYVEAPGLMAMDCECQGFFAHLDYADEAVLDLTFIENDFRRGDSNIGTTVPIQLVEGVSLVDSVEAALEYIRSDAPPALRGEMEATVHQYATDSGVPKALSLLLYVVSEGLVPSGGRRSSVAQAPAGRRAPERGWRLGAAPHPTVHVLGAETGERMRVAETRVRKPAAGGTHASPRPHIRHAHWHGHWHGPLDGERELVPHWQWATSVAMKPDDDDGDDDDAASIPEPS